MAIERKTNKCTLSGFEIFERPNEFDYVRETKKHVLPCGTNLPSIITRQDQLFRFSINGCDNKFIDLSSMQLSMKCRLQTGTGANLDAARNTSPISGPLNNIFRKITCAVNHQDLYSVTDYAYVSHMTSILMKNEAQHRQDNNTELEFLDTNDIDTLATNTVSPVEVAQFSKSKLTLSGMGFQDPVEHERAHHGHDRSVEVERIFDHRKVFTMRRQLRIDFLLELTDLLRTQRGSGGRRFVPTSSAYVRSFVLHIRNRGRPAP